MLAAAGVGPRKTVETSLVLRMHSLSRTLSLSLSRTREDPSPLQAKTRRAPTEHTGSLVFHFYFLPQLEREREHTRGCFPAQIGVGSLVRLFPLLPPIFHFRIGPFEIELSNIVLDSDMVHSQPGYYLAFTVTQLLRQLTILPIPIIRYYKPETEYFSKQQQGR